jgi:D-apionolactonase
MSRIGTRSRYELWYGRDEPPLEPRVLRAGPLLAELHGCDLRYVRSSSNEVVRRVYMAVRDLNWGTLPVTVESLEVEEGDDSFRVRFDARNTKDEIDFAWTGTIEGTNDGVVSYELDGVAGSAFSYAKIGLCIHHPFRESAGRLFRGEAPTTPVGGALPSFIGPQIHLRDEGWDLPLFEPVSWLEIDLPRAERVRFDFEGDLFEMEDQRNWTDGSFKTSSTPASLGYRFQLERGGRIRQRLAFHVEGATGRPAARQRPATTVRVGDRIGIAVPPIGIGSASHAAGLGERDVERLRALRPAHLRVDLRPGELERLARVSAEAAAIGCALEVALFANGDDAFAGAALETLHSSEVPVARLLVFDDGTEVTPLDILDRIRAAAGDMRVGGGTNVYFNELNRNRPDPERMAVVAYSMNPQIHAFDELSLVEALEAQAETVRSAHAFCGPTPVAVTPVTLRPRFNAVATVEEAATEALPWEVDPRQMSLFGAAWTLGSVASLAPARVESLTYFETTGPRGVLECEERALPAFPSTAGEVFPLYHVLADVCDLRGAEIVESAPDDPLSIASLAARRDDGGSTLLLANLGARPKAVRLDPGTGPAVVTRLNERTAPRRNTERVAGLTELAIGPFETVRIDA